MARLPQVGGDNGDWGVILNDFLSQSHSSDGSLKNDTVGTPQIKDGAVTNATVATNSLTEDKFSPAVQTKLNSSASTPDGSITEAKLDAALATKINTPPTVPVTSVNTKTGAVSLGKTDVGLGNVDDVSVSAHGMGVAIHGSNTATARPTGFAVVTWIGSVSPTNAIANDIWVYKA